MLCDRLLANLVECARVTSVQRFGGASSPQSLAVTTSHKMSSAAEIPTPDMRGWFAEKEDEALWPGALRMQLLFLLMAQISASEGEVTSCARGLSREQRQACTVAWFFRDTISHVFYVMAWLTVGSYPCACSWVQVSAWR